ncbi:hypothetical protein E4T38_03670 [Aureobasidium subglaciale]|nr:hypothetical protein E4T38_03670 [Aureobasidium subglaciale]KAI5224945.1 hypothetical protein E4T41_05418 [Aureobasidium subglaciale]KAI5225455.1 hypothetical protein E4T40_03445 [Aureobasidium subglaciale]KAI5261121.1 hypothetical protein E4T46_05311 [Aureobasidium subglaciale]
MPLEVRQVEAGDIADIARMDRITMKDVGISRAIWKIQEAEGMDITYSFMRFISIGMEHHAKTFWKVVDTESNELVAVGKFTFQYHEGEAYQDTPVGGEEAIPKSLLDFFAWLNVGSTEFAKQNFTGRRHAREQTDLAYLATHPMHRKRGAARMLLEKGTKAADEAGLDMYLQASPVGVGVYQKFGFEVVSVEDIDLNPYGVDKVDTRTYMKRVAQSG